MVNSSLGRGLGSLIPSQPNRNLQNTDTQNNEKNGVLKISVDKIIENPFQPRKKFTDAKLNDLASSIKTHGIIQPLVVVRKGDGFELIAGERRLRASKIAGLKEVPVILKDVDNKEKLELALIENIQRENLNPIDLAMSYKQLQEEFNLTQEEAAKQLGKSRSSIANTLRLLNLPDEIKKGLIEEKITEGHAKYILGLDNPNKQLNLYNKITRVNLSVDDTNKEAQRMGGTKLSRTKINYADKDKEFYIREFFGAKAEIKRKGKGGQIIINFYSDEELMEIVNKIKK